MSDTQTLTDRTPSILNKEPTDKKPKNDKSPIPLKHEFDPTGLVQRCVIIQRDENGFGLTVSGDNPVFVQLVKEDGAAMRAGVQTGDRIIKVNGTLVTHSNHTEVVKLIKSGSYVALTVLGRPPGLPQMPLEEEDEVPEGEGGGVSTPCSLSAPHTPTLTGGEQCSPPTCCPQEHITPTVPNGDENKTIQNQKDGQQDLQDGTTGSRNTEAEEGDSGLHLSEQVLSLRGDSENASPWTSNISIPISPLPERVNKSLSPNTSPQDRLNLCPSPADTEEASDMDSSVQCIMGSPPYHLNPQIIGAEDDYFDTQHEQINEQCSCFQNLDLLKTRPAHLAAFLHHVVSQFDPAPLLCYLYADLHKQTNSKESRRMFMDFHSLFIDRAANLKVPVPDSLAADLERRRLELIPEELCKQYTQVLQETLLPDLNKNLEDFRQKRSMGLTLAEDELCKLDSERQKDQAVQEREYSCAEHIISKIEDILLTSQPTEEEKCTTMQYVILTYMKHLGVKVKEPRSFEHKRTRMNFLPKIKKSIKPEERVKKPRFPNILVPPRRLSRVDSTSVGKAVDLNKQRLPKQLPQPALSIPEHAESAASHSGRTRAGQLSEGSEPSTPLLPSASPPSHSTPAGQASEASGPDSDSSVSPFSVLPRLSDGSQAADHQDGVPSPTQFDFSSSNLEQPQEDDQEAFSRMEAQCLASPADVQSEDDQGTEVECEEDPLNWQSLVSRGVLASLTPQEIKRQEVINELFYTERAHLRMLKVLDGVFHQRLNRDSVLPPEDIRNIFTNLEEILQLHVSITEQMMAIRKRSETSVISQIGDDLLAWFGGEEKIKMAAGTFCSNQPSALELIKTRKKKDQKFSSFMQEAESNRLCRRLQLKDIIPVEMQRLTKYPLLLENIAKYTEDGEEREKVKKAGECCKKILNHVNQAVKEAENKQRLVEYQRRLDVSSLKQNENSMILELKNLDLTKRKMIHEGPLLWKVNKEKTIELYTILLEDILVLLQKQDERLLLKFHGKNLAGATDTKHIFSPIIKLNTVLVRPVATDNKSFFVLSMSENRAQIYELTAQTVSDQRTWQRLITQCADAMKAKLHSGTPRAQTDAERDAIEIINHGMTKPGKDATSAESIHPSDLQPSPSSMNPFEGMKSEEEEEEEDLVLADRQEEEEEVDEEELQAFLDGELGDRLPFLQDESCQGVTAENQENNAFSFPFSKAEDALRTLAMLKQVLLNHMISREAEEEKEEAKAEKQLGASGCLLQEPPAVSEESFQKHDAPLCSAETALFETTERNGGFVVLDFGSEESSTDDDGGVGGDVGIDLRKLLSSSSQLGGGGPNLSRQLMTHLRLLQADLQYLKEVEMKYNQLQQTLNDTSADSDDNNDQIQS